MTSATAQDKASEAELFAGYCLGVAEESSKPLVLPNADPAYGLGIIEKGIAREQGERVIRSEGI
jgi:hypothetical protein